MGRVALYRGNTVVAHALVDDEEVAYLESFKNPWRISHYGYACTTVDSRTVLMHRVLMKAQPGQFVDHENRNRLDNRRCNLRFASHQLNNANTNAKGVYYYADRRAWRVYYYADRRAWRACIMEDGVTRWLGTFSTEQEAKDAYESARQERLHRLVEGVKLPWQP